jgi:hypothetical protein
MFPKGGLLEKTNKGGKEEKNNRVFMKYITAV